MTSRGKSKALLCLRRVLFVSESLFPSAVLLTRLMRSLFAVLDSFVSVFRSISILVVDRSVWSVYRVVGHASLEQCVVGIIGLEDSGGGFGVPDPAIGTR